ncbi:F-box/kelch-repeat protein At3g06240-like [Spinacia oleracea]|uniref:F-box/kelch-repeat protein At3g06240-like n=1 Tax=Spinacia oleracea TaxID=3562 RepID=A0ABM3RQY9_SPIOL|nr:F-box/kelch-repeat protein At3g06240-like [Spinacia oleracea]
MYGLGYDSVSDDYRVVMISHKIPGIEPGCIEMFVDVYSVGNGTWKRVDSSPYNHTISDFEAGVFVDGSIHWLARKTTDESCVIAVFNLREEKFRELPLPSLVDKYVVGDFDDEVEDLVFDKLAGLGGYLCGYLEFLDNCQSIDAWMMKKYGVQESWTKIFVNDDPYSSFRPICLYKKKQMVLLMHEDNIDEKLAIYNSEDGTLKDIELMAFQVVLV